MFKCIISAFKEMRMRSQIFLFEIIILLFVLVLAGAATYVELRIFYYISTHSSETMISKLDIKQINQATTLVSHYIKQKHQRRINLIEHLSSFLITYQIQSPKFTKVKQMESCINSELLIIPQYFYQTPKFCYQLHGVHDLITLPQNNQNISLLYDSLGLMNEYDLLFSIESSYFIQVVDNSDYKFDIVYPIGMLINGYDPKTRPWYVNHIKQMEVHSNELYFYSEVYKVFIEQFDYQFSITHSLFNSKKQFIGIAKTMLTTNDPSFEYVLYNIILINYAGQVLYNGMEMWQNLTDIFYVFNETITGFNQTDWYKIEQHAINRLSRDNSNQILILYNKYHKKFVHVQCEKFQKENFTLIIFTNVSSINIMEKQFQEIEQSFIFWYFLAASIIISICSLTITISLIVINSICQPLIKLTNQVSLHVLQLGNNINQQIFKMFNKQIYSLNLLNNLNNKFMNFQELLLQSQTTKCETCRLLEKMNFNKKESNINLKLIQNQNILLPEFRFVEQIQVQDIIKKSLFQGESMII
ncbi:unnamed protein product [Paramecium pentaurelia]|uniref:Transmembrane protein n=1 Tax=Paramecium pentaurelia TaxID=43138 RepID=A0A8S1VNH7_9CILI|nr:unnamed protein product [Paramecium pentaurelia]